LSCVYAYDHDDVKGRQSPALHW